MGFWDAVLGRTKPTGPDLDSLFALPSASMTLQVSLDMMPTGRGSVAFRAPEGRAFADVERDVQALIDAGGGRPVELAQDDYGFTWLVVNTSPPDVPSVVTDVHAANTSLVQSGFGPQLLCSLVSFRDPTGTALALVYLFKRGTFYPFVPVGDPATASQRDNVMELRIRDLLAVELPFEQDVSRWFPVWGAPGL